ncbi:MAG: hypothetical protein ACI9Y7_000528 [Dokdonia sp.]|jgi:hypothetical protein
MKVTWTRNAKRSYDRELGFILKKWSIKEVSDFMILVDRYIETLELEIFEGKIHLKPNVFSGAISKQTKVFFKKYPKKRRNTTSFILE